MTLQKNNPREIRISASAAEDLRDVWDYVAQYGEISAVKLVKEINRKFILLRDNPHIGREQDSYLVGLRIFVVKDYFIFYLPMETGIDFCAFCIVHATSKAFLRTFSIHSQTQIEK